MTSRLYLRITALSLLFAVVTAAEAVPAAAAPNPAVSVSSAPDPFSEPSFAAACSWHQFGEGEQPPWWLMLRDPLCVEYSKRDITLDNGGALAFLKAEPARIAVSLPTCRYYQRDHWSVQTTSGATALVSWDGQYWWDKPARRAGIRLTNFRLHGQPVGVLSAAAALRPYFPSVADQLEAYGHQPGESGATVSLPPDILC